MTSCMYFASIIQWIYFTIWEKIKKNRHHYNTILSFYNIKTLLEEFAKKSNIPWIWRIIYWHKLPYMKKTRKKNKYAVQLASWQLRSNSSNMSVRLSICGQDHVRSVSSTILVGSISYLHILSSNFRRCVACDICFKIQKFWQILLICNFDFVFFWLGIQYDSIEWVIMRRRGVSSECRRSSCSSWDKVTVRLSYFHSGMSCIGKMLWL